MGQKRRLRCSGQRTGFADLPGWRSPYEVLDEVSTDQIAQRCGIASLQVHRADLHRIARGRAFYHGNAPVRLTGA